MKNLNKMTWEPCIFERTDVFFTIWAWEQCVFQKIDVFVTIWALERVVFLHKSEKNKRTIYVFEHIWSWQQGVFHEKSEKKRPESIVFLKEWTLFLTKCRHKMILENERFLTKCGHESSIFFVKNRKKRVSYRLFCPII